MRQTQVAGLGGRRLAARAISRVRAAPYLRKWLVLGALIGVVAGLGAVVFYDGLRLATHLLLTDVGGYTPASTAGEGGYHAASGFARPWAIPLVVGGGGLVAGLLVFGLAPEAEGHGTDAAIRAVHTNPKGVRSRVIGVKLLASAITIGSGGSGGREGPTAQISSGFGSVLARALNLTPSDSRICVAAGIASGIGAIFRAPFGGALLGVELLYIDDMEIEALVPSVVATVVGYAIFGGITGSFSPIWGNHSGAAIAHAWQLALFVVVGLAAGAVGWLYTKTFYQLTDWFARWSVPRPLKPALAGLVVGAIGLAIPGVLGTGYGELQGQLMLGQLLTMPLWIVAVLPFAKLLATSLSIGTGGSGGIFGPGMVIGGATGALLWRLLHLIGLANHEQVAFVIVGMAACFGSIAHAPIAVLLMVAEMTGSAALLPAAMVAVAFAMLLVGRTTIYRSQLGRRADSPAHRFDFGLPTPAAIPVASLMTAPRLVLAASTTADQARGQLAEAGVPGAPVVNADGAFIGTIHRSMLDAHAGADGTVAGGGGGGRAGGGEGAGRGRGAATVGRLADVEAMTLPVEAGLDAAIEALPASRGGWVPVLDDDMRVVGIFSPADLAKGWRQTMSQSVRRLAGAATRTGVVEGVVPDGAAGAGRTLAELHLPIGAVVVSTIRDGAFVFPTPALKLRAGDTVTVLGRAANAEEIRRLIGLPADDAG